ncbi:MAG: DUF7453 family protein [Candidatus Wenzhouxiangella sp. M2_3B_020]
MKPLIACLLLLIALPWLPCVPAWAQPTRTILVQQFDDAPDGQGGSDTNFGQGFQDPVLNDNGQVAFTASLTNNFNGIFRTDGTNAVQIARWGDPAPDATGADDGYFGGLLGTFTWLNGGGQVAFRAGITDLSGVSQGQGIWIGDGTNLDQVVRSGQAAPDGNGTFPATVHTLSVDGFNDTGEIAFGIRLDGTANGSDDDVVVVRGSASGLVTIAREGTDFDALRTDSALNENGQVLFRADPDADALGYGIYVGDGTSTQFIAETYGTLSPGGLEFTGISGYTDLNILAETAWEGELRDPSSFDAAPTALFRGGPSGVVRIATVGDSAPDGEGGFDGTFLRFNNDPFLLNDAGQVVFSADLDGASDGFEGLFRGDGSELVAIARPGDPAPDGNGTFSNISSYAINELGHVLFLATLTGTADGSSDDRGLFLYDDSAGVLTAVREGGSLEGATVQGFAHWLPPRSIESAGFNGLGFAAFAFVTTAGIDGIALFDPDLPTEPPPPPVEDCVNGIDDDGDGDVDSADADCPEKLLVRCLHDPLFPAQSSQTVRLRAQAVDQDGRPFDAASLEIWRENDLTAPIASTSDIDVVNQTFIADADFGYSCRAEHNGLTAFSGWRRVQAGGPLDFFPANPVLFNGPFDRKVDLVFFASQSDYAGFDDPEFIRDTRNLLYEGLFRIPWFIEHQDMFNIWIGKDLGDSGPDPGDGNPSNGISCRRVPPENLRRDYLFAQAAAIVHPTACRDNAGRYAFTIETQPGRLQVLGHEAGHTPFGMFDEYCCDGGYQQNEPFANEYRSEQGCKDAAEVLGFDPGTCTAFTDVDDEDWWLFEPRKNALSPEPGDLMQGTGCTIAADPSLFPNLSDCTQVPADFSGNDADPNGLLACDEYGQTYFADPDGVPDGSDENLWLCVRSGNASNAVWVDRSNRDQYRIGDSERTRMSWFLSRCLSGEC